MAFTKAVKHQAKLRMALIGPSGAGKTYTALQVATGLGKRVAVIDTERGSACHYATLFNFDVCELDNFSPDHYIQAIHDAEEAGYDVLIIDSLSHAWIGKDGALEMVDNATARTQSKNSFAAWREVTPKHNALVDAMVSCKCHIIVTMRAKMAYEVEQDEKTRRTSVRKIGLAPIQRDGLEYEFDVVADMTIDNVLIVSKTRYASLTGKIMTKPGADLAKLLNEWLTDATPRPAAPAAAPSANGHEPPAAMTKTQPMKGAPPVAISPAYWTRWDALQKQAVALGIFAGFAENESLPLDEETQRPIFLSQEHLVDTGKALKEILAIANERLKLIARDWDSLFDRAQAAGLETKDLPVRDALTLDKQEETLEALQALVTAAEAGQEALPL